MPKILRTPAEPLVLLPNKEGALEDGINGVVVGPKIGVDLLLFWS